MKIIVVIFCAFVYNTYAKPVDLDVQVAGADAGAVVSAGGEPDVELAVGNSDIANLAEEVLLLPASLRSPILTNACCSLVSGTRRSSHDNAYGPRVRARRVGSTPIPRPRPILQTARKMPERVLYDLHVPNNFWQKVLRRA